MASLVNVHSKTISKFPGVEPMMFQTLVAELHMEHNKLIPFQPASDVQVLFVQLCSKIKPSQH